MDEIFETQGHYDPPACWAWPLPSEALKTQFPDEGDLLLAWHEHRCAACGTNMRDLVEDHDHETGLTRGYLCRSCNQLEWRHKEPGCNFTMYRSRTPAMILGIESTYVNMFGATPMRPPRIPIEQLQELVDRRWRGADGSDIDTDL